MGQFLSIALGFDAGKGKKPKEAAKSKNRENIIFRLSASLARALEGEFNLY